VVKEALLEIENYGILQLDEVTHNCPDIISFHCDGLSGPDLK